MNWQRLFKKQSSMAANERQSTDVKKQSFKVKKPRTLFKRSEAIKSTRDIKRRTLIGTALAITGAALVLFFIGQHTSPDFLLVTTALLALCGLIFYDMSSRKFWVNTISDQFQIMTRQQDRVVREVAKNRNELHNMRTGLADAAKAVKKEARRGTFPNSIEARMLDTMANHMEELSYNTSGADGDTKPGKVLELQMMPPPKKAAPLTESEQELVSDYSSYSDETVLEILQTAIRHSKVDIFMQPVVTLPQRQTKIYELYGRIRMSGGSYLSADQYRPVAEKYKLISTIDNLLLLRGLELLKGQLPFQGTPPTTPYMLNISAETLKDRGFMGDLVTFLSKNIDMSRRLVFELSQSDLNALDQKSFAVLQALGKLGCRFSMDCLHSRHIDLDVLQACNVKFLKLDANWMISEVQTEDGLARLLRIKRELDISGINLIVERIEDEGMLLEVLDFNIEFGQGYLFGKPDMIAAYITPYMPGNSRPKRSAA